MRKTEYLDLLRFYLKPFPKAVIDDIIQDYEEHFAIGVHKGKTEEEISEELVSPKIVADEYLAGDFERRPSREPDAEPSEETVHEETHRESTVNRLFGSGKTEKEKLILVLIILGAVVLLSWLLPTAFGVVGGVIGLVVAVVIGLTFGLGGLAIGSIVFGVSLILGNAIAFFPVTGWIPRFGTEFLTQFSLLTRIFFGLGFIGFGSLLMILAKNVFMYFITSIRKLFYYIKWQINKRRAS